MEKNQLRVSNEKTIKFPSSNDIMHVPKTVISKETCEPLLDIYVEFRPKVVGLFVQKCLVKKILAYNRPCNSGQGV